MPEVIFPGPEGRLEGRYHPQRDRDAPIAIVLHPHPQFGGTMNNKVVYNLHYAFLKMGFTVLRFNFRGVGRSQGEYDQGVGELSDAASALDYLQSMNANSKHCWVAGFSFGAWIGMQLLMRRPEITGFVSVAPPANMYDFSFLAPCPASGLIINGTADRVAPPADTEISSPSSRSSTGSPSPTSRGRGEPYMDTMVEQRHDLRQAPPHRNHPLRPHHGRHRRPCRRTGPRCHQGDRGHRRRDSSSPRCSVRLPDRRRGVPDRAACAAPISRPRRADGAPAQAQRDT